jgi:hypothetical protein
MIKYCIEQWDKNQDKLKEVLKTDSNLNACDYKYIVELIIKHILNGDKQWDYYDITEIGNGDYEGTLLYMIHENGYQPCEFDYLMTYIGYGSCSGCDVLLSIQNDREEKITDIQVDGFMKLCRDLIVNMIKPYNYGWREEPEFAVVEESVITD